MDGETTQPARVHLSLLLEDVMRMAIHAVETGKLAEEISLAELYRIWDIKFSEQGKLSLEDITYLEYCYRNLEADLSPVTAVSLKATEVIDDDNKNNFTNTQTGKRLKNMWVTSFLTLAVILILNFFIKYFELVSSEMANPEQLTKFELVTVLYIIAAIALNFAYGAFGASVRLLRVTQAKMRERTYDPRAISEEQHRFVLGMISGGLFVFLYKAYFAESDGTIVFSEAILGFLAGYSIDLLFTLIDRIVSILNSSINPTKIKSVAVKMETKVKFPKKNEVTQTAVDEIPDKIIKEKIPSASTISAITK